MGFCTDRAAAEGHGPSASCARRRAGTLPAVARLTQHGLRRVLGTSALFSTAYGNVGSSIYYALGLVASYALGLTPVVFLITGVIFYLTAATYAEATAMYPGGGRLLVVRASRVQRAVVVLRGLGADAQLHDHDRDLRVLRAALPRRAVLAGAPARPRRRRLRDRRGRRCCRSSTSSASKRRRA